MENKIITNAATTAAEQLQSILQDKKDVSDAAQIAANQLPQKISETFNNIVKYDAKINEAKEKATELAEKAYQKDAGWSLFGSAKKEAIEALQIAVKSQSEVIDKVVDSNKDLFDNQAKMAKGVSYLFGLGVLNMATNRTVVRELELRLQHASKEELSELARQEIENVILQLRAQEDMQNKIQRNEEVLREHHSDLVKLEHGIEELQTDFSLHRKFCEETLDNVRILENKILDAIDKQKNDFEQLNNKIIIDFNSRTKELQDILTAQVENAQQKFEKEYSERLKTIDETLEDLTTFKKELLASRSFLDTHLYKAIIGLIAVSGLICSLIM